MLSRWIIVVSCTYIAAERKATAIIVFGFCKQIGVVELEVKEIDIFLIFSHEKRRYKCITMVKIVAIGFYSDDDFHVKILFSVVILSIF